MIKEKQKQTRGFKDKCLTTPAEEVTPAPTHICFPYHLPVPGLGTCNAFKYELQK